MDACALAWVRVCAHGQRVTTRVCGYVSSITIIFQPQQPQQSTSRVRVSVRAKTPREEQSPFINEIDRLPGRLSIGGPQDCGRLARGAVSPFTTKERRQPSAPHQDVGRPTLGVNTRSTAFISFCSSPRGVQSFLWPTRCATPSRPAGQVVGSIHDDWGLWWKMTERPCDWLVGAVWWCVLSVWAF